MAISVKDPTGKRIVGSFNFPGNFEVKKEGPLDTRSVVGSITDLLDTTNIEGENKYQYFGMLVAVSGDPDPENDGVYRLLEGGNPTLITGWEKLGTGSGSGGDDTFITGGTITDSILTLGYSDDKDPIIIDFEECCGGGLSEVYISAFEIPTVETVGGITNGTPVQNLTGKTFSEIFDLMFFPTQTPSGSNSKPSYDNGVGNIFEIGEVIEITHTTGADRGGWSPSTYAGGVVQPSTFRGPVTNAFLTYSSQYNDGSSTQDGVELYNSTDGITIDNPTETYTVVAGTQGWKLSVSYSDGDDPFDSTGEVITDAGGAAIAQDSNPDNFEGTYPIYVVNENGSFSQIPLIPLTSNPVTLGINFAGTTPGAATFEFRIPKAFGTPTNIVQKDPFGNWGALNQLEVQWGLDSITLNTDHDSNVDYHTFTWDNSLGKIGAAEFKITI